MSHQHKVYAAVLISFFTLIFTFWYNDPGTYVGNVGTATLVFDDQSEGSNSTKLLPSSSEEEEVSRLRRADNLVNPNNVPETSAAVPQSTALQHAKQTNQSFPKLFEREIITPPSTLKIPLPKKSPLESCSLEQLKYIHKGLPSSNSIKWMTNCPDATWLDGWKPNIHEERKNPQDWPILFEPSLGRKPISIFVGCNKAMDAVSTLRILSRNATYDKHQWRETMQIESSACSQHSSPQIPIPEHAPSRPATVYCIEAMPSTSRRLNQSIAQLGWDKELRIHQAAISDTDGMIRFPDARVGTEELGISHCNLKRFQNRCEQVPQYRLDSFLREHALDEDKPQNNNNSTTLVDFLSIDVEGFDWLVLLGASQTLDKTKYLEFEYNSVGPWLHHNLSTAISYLSTSKGFTCYWAGVGGKLWRMTGCWIDIWDTWKQWSNVACIHAGKAPTLAAKMEDRFRQTLRKGGYRDENEVAP